MTPLSRLFWPIFENISWQATDSCLKPSIHADWSRQMALYVFTSMRSQHDLGHETKLCGWCKWLAKSSSPLERDKTFLGVRTCRVKESASSTPRAKKRARPRTGQERTRGHLKFTRILLCRTLFVGIEVTSYEGSARGLITRHKQGGFVSDEL